MPRDERTTTRPASNSRSMRSWSDFSRAKSDAGGDARCGPRRPRQARCAPSRRRICTAPGNQPDTHAEPDDVLALARCAHGLAEWLQERRMAVSSKTPATRSPRARTSGATRTKPARTRQRKPRVEISTEGLPIGGQPKPKPKPSPSPRWRPGVRGCRRHRRDAPPPQPAPPCTAPRQTSTRQIQPHLRRRRSPRPQPQAKTQPVVGGPAPSQHPDPPSRRGQPRAQLGRPTARPTASRARTELAAATSRLEALPDLGQAAARRAAGLDDLPDGPAPAPRPVAQRRIRPRVSATTGPGQRRGSTATTTDNTGATAATNTTTGETAATPTTATTTVRVPRGRARRALAASERRPHLG